MIAFHFPPVAMGSGHLRTLGFARHLPSLGWEPTVLSANAAAFPRVDADNLKLIPENCRVHRAFALDVRRHLSIRGKYAGFMAQPDGWASWWPAAVLQGLRQIRRHQINAIWSTYPIMTAHCIAYTLSRMSGLPWVADFRDPVASSVDLGNRFSVASQKRWERRVLAHAARTVFTTSGAMRGYAERYPQASMDNRLVVIPNGYDEADFSAVPFVPGRRAAPFVLVHSGLLYPDGRDPSVFFAVLGKLKRLGKAGTGMFRVVLRASGSEARYQQQIDRYDIADIVTLAPPVGSREALLEQAAADGLLLFQGSLFDRQIPAKVYDYLRIGKPIFALVGEHGDTATLLRETGVAGLVPLDDESRIEQGLLRFLDFLAEGPDLQANRSGIEKWSRRNGAVQLARLLDEVAV
jgi:hypothetical protein